MKKHIFLQAIFALTILLTGLSSCKKVWDQIKHHPDGAADNCRIEQFSFKWMYAADVEDSASYRFITDTARFTYNAAGNPTEMKFASSKYFHVDAFPSDKFFKYDDQNRLIVFLDHGSINEYNGSEFWDGAVFWHKYTYVNAHLITDTTFMYANGHLAQSNTPVFPAETSYERRIELDDFGRVVKETFGSEIITYAYDQSGNLIKPGVIYSNKKNIKQTNKIWMFLARDYSVNAPVGEAIQYNSNQLPVICKTLPFFIDDAVFWLQPNENIKVNYLCR